jgi:multiple sugar transport system ATP-binding protein
MAAVTVKNIGGVDLTFHDREFVVLAGPSGCGNSSIIRSIAGLAETGGGEVLFDERQISDLPPRDRDIAFLDHDYTPYPGRSVYQNLAIGLEKRKFANPEIEKRVASVADMLDLKNELAGSADSLSAEKRRLVGLARVMVRQPKVCLFDEPFAKLDRTAASRGRAAIAELRRRSAATTLYSTSDPSEALALGARTVLLDRGTVQQDADAHLIFKEPANLFVARFFAEHPMNLVEGTLKQDRNAVTFLEKGDGTIAVPLTPSRFPHANELGGRAVVLGFRPEAVEIEASPESGSRSGAIFRALVERSEERGSETDLYLRTGAHDLICRSRRWTEQKADGHRFQFEIDLEKAYLFDALSGRRLFPDR